MRLTAALTAHDAENVGPIAVRRGVIEKAAQRFEGSEAIQLSVSSSLSAQSPARPLSPGLAIGPGHCAAALRSMNERNALSHLANPSFSKWLTHRSYSSAAQSNVAHHSTSAVLLSTIASTRIVAI